MISETEISKCEIEFGARKKFTCLTLSQLLAYFSKLTKKCEISLLLPLLK